MSDGMLAHCICQPMPGTSAVEKYKNVRQIVTGGAGFIGAILVDRLIREGQHVALVDDLSRPGSEKNLAWLRQSYGDQFEF